VVELVQAIFLLLSGNFRSFGLRARNAQIRPRTLYTKKKRDFKPNGLIYLISTWWSMFCVALSAVNWSATVWLEGNFTFLLAFSTGCLVHLFWIHSVFSTPIILVSANVCFARVLVSCVLVLKLMRNNTRFQPWVKQESLERKETQKREKVTRGYSKRSNVPYLQT
jgi:hypothetical protein